MKDGPKINSFNNQMTKPYLSSIRKQYFISIALVIMLAMVLQFGEVPPLHAQEMIDPRSGRLLLTETDLVLRAGPINLEIQRTLQTDRGDQGLLGTQWRMNWEKYLIQTGSIVAVKETPGPIPFTQGDSKKEFKRPSGEMIAFQKDGQAIRTKLDGTKEKYDAKGRLVESEYLNSNKVRLSYNNKGQLERIEGPRGTYLKLTSDDKGRIILVETSTGIKVRYGYIKDNLTEIQINNGPPARYAYNEKGALVKIERPLTGVVEFTHDGKGRVAKRLWADGSEEFYEYDDADHTYRHINPAGGITVIKQRNDRKLEEITDPLGNKKTVEYDADHRPIATTGPTGETSRFGYDSQGRLVRVDGCCGVGIRLEYLGKTSLYKSVSRSDGSHQTFDYDDHHNLIAVKRGNETLAAITYYPDGLIKTIKGVGSSERSFTYYPSGLLRSETNALGQTTTYEYDQRGNLTRSTDSAGGITKWTYDDQDRKVSITDPDGSTTRFEYNKAGRGDKVITPVSGTTLYEYDSRGRLIAKTGVGGRTTHYKYDPNGYLSSVTYPGGGTNRYTYDASGNRIQEINPLGGVTTRSYNPLGRVISESDFTGQTWRYKYSNAGLLSQMVDPLGGMIEYRYDTRWRMNEVVDPAGRITRYQYDDKDRVTRVIFPEGLKITYAYDREGNLSMKADNRGTETKYEYDALGRLIIERRAQGLEITYRYDALGRLLEWKDNLGGGMSFEYNPQGLVSSRRNAAGVPVQYRYDPNGRLLEGIDPLGHLNRLEYTAAGELAKMIGPSGDKIQYVYDLSGALNAIHHPGGGVRRFAFDAMGNRIEEVNPLGAKIRSAYDKAGRFISTTDAKGQTTTFAYDPKGHLVHKRLADGKTVNYKYDSLSHLIEVDDGVFPVHYAYDQAGRITHIEYPTTRRSIQFEYDNEGRIVSTSYEGRKVRRGYDQFGRLGTVEIPGSGTFIFAYDAKDRLISMTYPNGVKGNYEYDGMDRPVKLFYTKSSGESIAGWTYSYDSAGNPTKVIGSAGRTTQYVYDRAGQLTEEAGPYGKLNYSYLPGSNRAKVEGIGKTVQYSYNKADQLLKAGEENLKYDPNGNLIEKQGPKGVTKYTYDSENHLVKVQLPDRQEISFGYAPIGERIWRKDKSGLTWFVTDGLNVLAELDQNLLPKASYLHGPGIDFPLMFSVNGKNYFYHANPLGSIAALTDGDGQIAASYQTDAFGRVLERKGNVPNPFIFTGREYEPEVGLYYYRARYYDPDLGRFLSEDPIRDPFKLNKYAYAFNAPTRYSDPLGLVEDSVLQPVLTRHGLTEQQFKDQLLNPSVKKMELFNQAMDIKSGGTLGPATREELTETAKNLLHKSLRDTPVVGQPAVQAIRDQMAYDMRNMRNFIKNPPPVPPPDPFGGLKIAESSPDNGAILQNRTDVRPGAGPNLGIGERTLAHETKVITPGQPAEPSSPFDTGAYPPVRGDDTRVIQGPPGPKAPERPSGGPSPAGDSPSPSLLNRSASGGEIAGGVLTGVLTGYSVGSSYAEQARQEGRNLTGGEYVRVGVESAVRADLSVVTLGGSEVAISMGSEGAPLVAADQRLLANLDAERRQQQEAQKRNIQAWIGQAASLSGEASSLKQRQEVAINEAKSWLVKAQGGLNKLNQISPIPENVIQDNQKLCADCQAKIATFLNTKAQQLKSEINACISKVNANNAVINQAKESLGTITSIVSETSSCGENAWKASSLAKSFPSQCNGLRARAATIYNLIITSGDLAVDGVIDSKIQVDDICNEVFGRANNGDTYAGLADSIVQGLIGKAEALKGQIGGTELCYVDAPTGERSGTSDSGTRSEGQQTDDQRQRSYDDLQRRLSQQREDRNRQRRDREAADASRGYGTGGSTSTQGSTTDQTSTTTGGTITTGGTGPTTPTTGGTGPTPTGGTGPTTPTKGGTQTPTKSGVTTPSKTPPSTGGTTIAGVSQGSGQTSQPSTVSIRADSGHIIQINFPNGEGKSVKQGTLQSGKYTQKMNTIMCPDVKGYVDAAVNISVVIGSDEAYYIYTIRDVWDDSFRNLVVKRGVNRSGKPVNEGDLKRIASDFNVFVDIFRKGESVGRTYFCVRGAK